MLLIRSEEEKDYGAIREVNLLAFESEGEANLIEALRRSADFIPDLSLVAVKDNQVIGHILFSLIGIDTPNGAVSALALAPLAVHPEFQNLGIGSDLIRLGLEKCQKTGHKIIIVIGHPKLYSRFGFSPAAAKGLSAPFEVPDEAFMALELVPGALDGISGIVKYPAAFDEVG